MEFYPVGTEMFAPAVAACLGNADVGVLAAGRYADLVAVEVAPEVGAASTADPQTQERRTHPHPRNILWGHPVDA